MNCCQQEIEKVTQKELCRSSRASLRCITTFPVCEGLKALVTLDRLDDNLMLKTSQRVGTDGWIGTNK